MSAMPDHMWPCVLWTLVSRSIAQRPETSWSQPSPTPGVLDSLRTEV